MTRGPLPAASDRPGASPSPSPSATPAPDPPTSSPAYPSPTPTSSPAYPTSTGSAAPSSSTCDQGEDLIAEAVWISVEGGSSLEVTPTSLLRGCPQVAPAWAELLERVPEVDSPGMEDQLRCHVLFAPAKDVWHLEPWRPAVDWPEMIQTRCNPGAPDPDQS